MIPNVTWKAVLIGIVLHFLVHNDTKNVFMCIVHMYLFFQILSWGQLNPEVWNLWTKDQLNLIIWHLLPFIFFKLLYVILTYSLQGDLKVLSIKIDLFDSFIIWKYY
jgi:hypothetical protein